MAETNRRVYVRIPVQIEAAVRDPGMTAGEIYFLTRDLSLGGLFLESDLLFDRGTRLEVRFDLPGIRSGCHASGEVVWTHDGEEDGIPGMGMAFEQMDLETMDALTAYIRDQAGQVTHTRR